MLNAFCVFLFFPSVCEDSWKKKGKKIKLNSAGALQQSRPSEQDTPKISAP